MGVLLLSICPIGLAFSAFSFDAVMGAPAKFLNAGPLIIKVSVTAGERDEPLH